MDFWQILSSVATLGGAWIASRFIRTNRDRYRAEHLARVAESLLSVIMVRNPNARVEDLIRSLVAGLRQAKITSNDAVLERVAGEAVLKWKHSHGNATD